MKKSKFLKIRDLSFKFSHSVSPRLGLIVSKKYGDSVRRNLFKRRCRALFKTQIIDNNIFFSVVVQPNEVNISHKSINEAFAVLYNRLKN